MAQIPTDRFAECESLSLTSNNNDNFSTIKDSRYADRERHAGNSGNVVIEETSIGKDGIVSQRLDTRPGGE
jgi:hypothetical protein